MPIYGLGQDEDGPFYTMPFIEGQTLQEAIDAFHGDESLRRDPGRRALRFRGLLQQFIAVCNTMAYAHDQGVIHRDLKPSNIMLGPYGETLVMDWGLAKRLGTDDAGGEAEGDAPSPSPSPDALTATGAVLGTPQYMSPEQARGEPTGPASDVFSLGLILYAILTGKSPYADAVLQGADLWKAVREAAVVPPRRRDPGLPGALEAICLKALAARPEDRYSTARALADDLSKWLADEPVGACRDPFAERARRWAKRHRTAVTGGGRCPAGRRHRAGGRGGHPGPAQPRAGAGQRRDDQEKNKAEAALEESEEARRAGRGRAGLPQGRRAGGRPTRGPGGGLGKDVTVRKAVDAAEPKVAEAFKDQPIIEADVRDTLGLTYQYLGEYPLAIRQHERALELRRTNLGPTTPIRSRAATTSPTPTRRRPRRRGHRAAPGHARSCARPSWARPPRHAPSRNNLAEAYRAAGRSPRPSRCTRRRSSGAEAKLGPDHPDTLESRNNLAKAYLDAGRIAEAIELLPRHPRAARGEARARPPRYAPEPQQPRHAYRRRPLRRGHRAAPRRPGAARAKLGPDHPIRSRAATTSP